ncbi:hypothetical protein V5P93_004369 [Actinokineospora auranticolor]|uniref:Hsp70 protein n=1 Tax=Actinokineospora auranticolor TaxID=155976 RepID=A0A2S6GTL0_9PSEU|nr:hypothetical protein [Actinokineospora auranticolor]PPK68523.1 hypothetical protein CLV40_105252 [Actinokineospora auranticolor]
MARREQATLVVDLGSATCTAAVVRAGGATPLKEPGTGVVARPAALFVDPGTGQALWGSAAE